MLLALRSCPAGDGSDRDCVLAKEVHLDLRLHFHRAALHLMRTVVPLANRAHAGFCQCAAATQYLHLFDGAVGAYQGLQLQLPNQIAPGIDRMSKVTLRQFRDKQALRASGRGDRSRAGNRIRNRSKRRTASRRRS